ncbi:MAG: FecR family protein [Bacteroidales bacterium]|nr:FecR family protein [Bacteroidales bacterium]
MNIFELKIHLKKFRRNESTKDDLKKLREALTDDNNEHLVKDILLDELSDFKPNESEDQSVNFDRIYNSIVSAIDHNKHEKKFKMQITNWKDWSIMKLVKIAAIFILLFASGGVLSYYIFNHEERSVFSYNEICAPLGARSEVILPDGSKVWLNAGSKIRYLDMFNKKNRFVSLEGEAYFKVAKNKKLPFNVITGELKIVALGTEFNVKSYEDEGVIETTLVEGRVSIQHNQQKNNSLQTIFLKPHQKAVYIKEYQQLRVEDINTIRQSIPEILKPKKGNMYIAAEVDPAPVVSWKDNRLILKGEELSNLLIKLERKYNVTFNFESENLKHFRFTGTLEDETLTQVLDVIKLSAPIEYALKGKNVEIYENEDMMRKFSNHLKKK